MTNMSTFSAFYNIYLGTCPCLMTSLVAFKAYLFRTIERVMRILSAKYTRCLFSFIWAILLLVADLFTVVALNCWVILSPVSLSLQLLHVVEGVILVRFIIPIPVQIINWLLIIRLFVLIVNVINVLLFRRANTFFLRLVLLFSLFMISTEVFISSDKLSSR